MQAFANFKDLEGLLRHQKILYLIMIRNALWSVVVVLELTNVQLSHATITGFKLYSELMLQLTWGLSINSAS